MRLDNAPGRLRSETRTADIDVSGDGPASAVNGKTAARKDGSVVIKSEKLQLN